MPKIAFIGAGSAVFARRLMIDILSFEELRDSTLCMMDIDPVRLDQITQVARGLVKRAGFPTKVESTTDRRKAVDGADFVIVMIQAGGLDAFEYDVHIPMRYGVNQCVGDTLGPGGVFRGLRTFPALRDLCRDMEELCPDALLINYSNPMAMNCWAVSLFSSIKTVGLCHSVQGTTHQISSYIGAPVQEVDVWVAGINHMSWFLKFEHQGEDAYPRLRAAMDNPDIYWKDPVRFEILRHFDLFVTESSGHMSEYIPYYRRREILIKQFCRGGFLGEPGFYLRACKENVERYNQDVQRMLEDTSVPQFDLSYEYGAGIIHSMVTNTPRRINGNVPNTGLITNLPEGCCVEVPCLVDRDGLHPCHAGSLPPQAAALNNSNITVQEMAVLGGIQGDKRLVYHAILADPLTSAVLTPAETHSMVEDLFKAESAWLPQFQNSRR